LSTKPRDIKFPSEQDLLTSPPFVTPPNAGEIDPAFASVDFTTVCPVFKESGDCRHGLKCRFLGGHAHKIDNEPGIEVKKDQKREEELRNTVSELNFLGPGTLKQLRTKQVRTLLEIHLEIHLQGLNWPSVSDTRCG
jgi:tRNA-dihydrouridine synthase 3